MDIIFESDTETSDVEVFEDELTEETDIDDIDDDDIGLKNEEKEESDENDESESEIDDDYTDDIDGIEDANGDNEIDDGTLDIEDELDSNIDINELYEDEPKKTSKACFNRKKRTKYKVAKSIKKKKKTDECILINNCDKSELSVIRNKTIQLLNNNKKLEEIIYNKSVEILESKLEKKIKKSDISSEEFKNLYSDISYEFLSLSEQDIEQFQYKFGLLSDNFKNENFIDQQETKNIEEPPKSKPGIHTCYKCLNDKTRQNDPDRGKRTWYYELQTRSCDEPMTCFITCLDCGKRWKQ